MTKKKYRLKKRIKNFLVFYSFICIMFFASYTFSRYVETTSGNYSVGIAKFNVNVNEINVVEGESFDLILSPNTNTYNDKIAPGTEGYFELVINPATTEVSLEYSFVFNLEKLDENIILTNYKINDGNPIEVTDNTVKGEILLPSSGKAFTQDDIWNIKVYWEWNEKTDIINPVITDTDIYVTSVIKQKID